MRDPRTCGIVGVLALATAAACAEPPPEGGEAASAAIETMELADTTAPAAASPTLLAIMQQLQHDMTRAQQALWVEHFDGLAEAAGAVADHPPVSPEERARIQGVLGPDFPAFAQGDRRVHEAAVELREAAAARDTAAVLEALAAVQEGCVSCHAAFRVRVRGAAN